MPGIKPGMTAESRCMRAPHSAHSRASGNPESHGTAENFCSWVPACAGTSGEICGAPTPHSASWPGSLPQVGFTRFAALNYADVGQARRPPSTSCLLAEARVARMSDSEIRDLGGTFPAYRFAHAGYGLVRKGRRGCPRHRRAKHAVLPFLGICFARANVSGAFDLNYGRGGRPSKAGTPSAMRWKG
jgi:hypothetical protein